MGSQSSEIVIIGSGIVGVSTAYFLAKEGFRPILVERDSVGSHASGFAYGGLSPVFETGIPESEVGKLGFALHKEFAEQLRGETGIDIEHRPKTAISLTFTEAEANSAISEVRKQSAEGQHQVVWLEPHEVNKIEPRISGNILGARYTECAAEVEPYRLVLALTQAAESNGATVRHGRVIGLNKVNGKVTSVQLDHDQITCRNVVVAMGPWSAEATNWLKLPVRISPLKGQILRLLGPGPPVNPSVGWKGNYATTKPDGLLWTGTTEEEAGFDENPTIQGRNQIMNSLLKMLPSMETAQLVRHTACLRPLAEDRKLFLGPAPGTEGAFVATGAGRNGILLGPAMGRITADLITTGYSAVDIAAFNPGRFLHPG